MRGRIQFHTSFFAEDKKATNGSLGIEARGRALPAV